jgi:hypothetical protein
MSISNFYISYFRKRKLFYFSFALIYIILVIVFYLFFKDKIFEDKKSSIIESYETEFFSVANVLINKKDSNQVNIETLKFAFNSINRKSNGKLLDYGFVNLLEDYLVSLINDKTLTKSNNYYSVVKIIQNEIKQEPFSQLPNDQRRVLKNLESAINAKDSLSAVYNLTELNDILIDNNNQLQSMESENKWALPIGIVGAILTLLFGILTILSPISYKRMRDIIEDSIKKKEN